MSTEVWKVVYGRDKPYKVHKSWEFDGTATIKDRSVSVVDDDTNDPVGKTIIPPHKDIKEGLQFVVNGFLVRLEEIISGSSTRPSAVEQQKNIVSTTTSPKMNCKPFIPPLIVKKEDNASNSGVERGDVYSRNRDLSLRNYEVPLVKPKIEAPKEDLPPPAKKSKYSIFDSDDDSE